MFLIIHNPLSNNKKSKKTTNKMVKFFRRHSIPFKLRSTLKIENLNNLLDKNPKITDILYLGGDGSINYLINHVDVSSIKQNIYLAKSGSGNDFLRCLSKIEHGNISIGEAKTNLGTYRFINGAGAGIDSLICHYVNNDKKKSKISYFINFFRAILTYKRMDFDITVDGKKHTFKRGYLAAVQNGKYFGGGMKVAPKGDITSDEYEICVAHNLNNFLIQLLFITIYLGWHKLIKKRITFLKGKDIKIELKDTAYLQTDGEVIAGVNEISIKKAFEKEFYAFKKKNFKQKIAKRYHSN